MSRILPFRGLRYNPQQIPDLSRVTCPPYDVISPEGQKTLVERDPHNAVRLILGVTRPSDTDRDNRYTRAAADFRSWQEKGILVRDPDPSLYLYEQVFRLGGTGAEARRRGFIGLRRLEDFEGGKIRPHERTLAGPKEDRLFLMKACGANFSPVFTLYSDPNGVLGRSLQPFFEMRPESDFCDEEGVRHRFWRVADPDLFAQTEEIVGKTRLFIADGHHRYETAIAYRDWMKSRPPSGRSGDPAWNYVMMYFSEISDPGLVILPIHRVVRNLPGFDAARFLERLRERFQVIPFPAGRKADFLRAMELEGAKGHALGLLPGGEEGMHLLIPKSSGKEAIDSMILHLLILGEILRINEEEQQDPRFVEFVKDREEAWESRSMPGVQSVFLLNSPSREGIRAVFEAGEILPPKSTFFYPKLLTGLVMAPLS